MLATGARNYNFGNMRPLVGVALLLAAAAAFPQPARETHFLHGHKNSVEKFEIQPGVSVCARYGADGVVSHMAIRPVPRTGDAWRDSIPFDTINRILTKIMWSEGRPKLAVKEIFYTSCSNQRIASLEDLATADEQPCLSHRYGVHLALLDFGPPKVAPDGTTTMEQSVDRPPSLWNATDVAVLKAPPSAWCVR